jgi:hypothetical protein
MNRTAKKFDEFQYKITIVRDRQKIKRLFGDDFETPFMDKIIEKGSLSLFDWGWINGLIDALNDIDNDSNTGPKYTMISYELLGFEEGYYMGYVQEIKR